MFVSCSLFAVGCSGRSNSPEAAVEKFDSENTRIKEGREVRELKLCECQCQFAARGRVRLNCPRERDYLEASQSFLVVRRDKSSAWMVVDVPVRILEYAVMSDSYSAQ